MTRSVYSCSERPGPDLFVHFVGEEVDQHVLRDISDFPRSQKEDIDVNLFLSRRKNLSKKAVMHGKLDVDYANHKELRSVITEWT